LIYGTRAREKADLLTMLATITHHASHLDSVRNFNEYTSLTTGVSLSLYFSTAKVSIFFQITKFFDT